MRLLIAVLLSFTLFGQNPYGRITGLVTDSAGAVVPGASIKVINTATNATVALSTNAEGIYDMPNLVPGPYKVEVQVAGFKRYERGPIEVRVGDVLRINVQLELGPISESVVVASQAPMLEDATATLGHLVDNRRIQELPLPGQNPAYLTLLAPGVITTNAVTHGWLPLAVDVLSDIASNGARTRTSQFTVDGVPNMTRGGQMSFSPPPETLQEFKVETATYDASTGRFLGANVNMVLKSGTNQLHGSATYSHTSRPLMSVPFFVNKSIYDLSTGPVTQDKINRFFPGAKTNRYRPSASGPVYIPGIYDGRNRTFWMYGYDRIDRLMPTQSYLAVPTQAQRTGDFSALLALGASYQIYDPATTRPTTDGRYQRDPLPGNRIPANRLDSVATKIVSHYGLPNAAGTNDGRNNFSDIGPRNLNFRSHTARVDQLLGQSNRLSGSYTRSTHLEQYSRSFYPDLSRGQMFNRFHNGLSLSDVLTLRPNLIAELRYGWTRFKYYQRPYTLGFDLAELGISQSLVNQLDKATTAFPQVSIDGYAELGGVSGTLWATNTHTTAGTISNVRGAHTLRFGGELRAIFATGYNWGNIAPLYNASTTYTRGPYNTSAASAIGQGLASFLLGVPTGGSISNNASYANHSKYMGFFVQDDWKLSRMVTVNLGLRYELETPLTERFDRTNRGFDFTTTNPIQDAASAAYARSPIPEIAAANFRTAGGLLFANRDGVPRGLYERNANRWSPRIGIAWRATPSIVVRTGYGIFFDSIGADWSDVVQQGYSQSTLLIPTLDNGVTFRASLANPFPDGLTLPPGASGGLKTFLGRAPSYYTPTRRAGYLQRWSFGLQREFPHRVLLEVGYVGSRATGLEASEEFNPIPRQYLSTSPVRDQTTIDYLARTYPNPFAAIPEFAGSNLAGANVARSQLLRPYPHFTGITSGIAEGFSWYHSLETRVEKRFSHGYTMQATYTWQKLMLAVDKLNPTDPALQHVIAGQDRPHQIVVSGIYEFPFGRQRRWRSGAPAIVDQVLGGWQLQAVYQGTSGAPIGFGNIIFTGDLHKIVLPKSGRKTERWFNTDAGFEKAPARQLANNIRTFPTRLTGLRQDGSNNWNLSLLKNFRITEKLRFQLRAEAQDALNHAMFSAPNSDPTSSLFGQVTGTQFGEQRRVFLMGRLEW
jgi:hypothetical protein